MLYNDGLLKYGSRSFIKCVYAYLKKNDIDFSQIQEYLEEYTEDAFFDKLRSVYHITSKTITPKIILNAVRRDDYTPSEHDVQKAIVKTLRANKIDVFSVPNGFISGGDYKYMNYMKAEGLTPSAFDLVINVGNGRTLFLEVKTTKGRPSDKQIARLKFYEQNGYIAYIGYGYDDCMQFIRQYVSLK